MAELGELRVPALEESIPMVLFFIRGLCTRLGICREKEIELADVGRRIFARIIETLQPHQPAGDISVGAFQRKKRLTMRFAFGQTSPIDISAGGGLETVDFDSIKEDFRDLIESGCVSCFPASSPSEACEIVLTGEIGRPEADDRGVNTQRELRTMLDLSQSIAAVIELDDLLQYLINELVDAIGAERGTIYLLDQENQELFSKVLSQDTGGITEIRVRLGEGIAGHVAATGEVVNIENAYRDSRFNRSFDRATGFRTETLLATPMRDPHRKMVGVVQLINKKGGPFTDRDANLLKTLAGQAAIRIEHTRLYDKEIKRKVMDNELDRARQIQESFLPKEIPVIAGFDVAGKCVYSDKIGGDYFDVFPLGPGRPGQFAVVVGDVSGHGLSSALLMATARALIRLRASMPGPPSAVVADVNRQLTDDMSLSGEFMTLFFSVVDTRSRIISWVRAGHDPAVVYDAIAGRFLELGGEGVALGLDEDHPYREFERRLSPGQIVLIGTDGIWETHDSKANMFGKKALKHIVRTNASQPAAVIVTAVNQALDTYRGSATQEDDVTMVVVKVLAGE